MGYGREINTDSGRGSAKPRTREEAQYPAKVAPSTRDEYPPPYPPKD